MKWIQFRNIFVLLLTMCEKVSTINIGAQNYASNLVQYEYKNTYNFIRNYITR